MTSRGPSVPLLTLSFLLLASSVASVGHLISLVRAPFSTPVELGGTPAFLPATPNDLPMKEGQSVAVLAFIGDIMQHREQAGDDFSQTYQEIKPILEGYDLVIGNLEFPVDPESPVGPPPGSARFNGSPLHVRELSRAGVDVVTTANNHSFDQGLEGVLSTLEVLRTEGVESFGTGRRAEDLGPKILTVGELRLGFLAYTFPPNVYFDSEERPVPWPRTWPLNQLYFGDWSGAYRDEGINQFSRHVEASRAADTDLTIAFVHWGREWKFAPDRHQRLAAQDMVEAGFDLVIGSHSHVLNPAEIVNGKLVAYSLGNFVSAFREPEVRTSAVLEVTVVVGPDGQVGIGDFAFRPILTRGKNHRIRPITSGAGGKEGEALGFARDILGESAVRAFSGSGQPPQLDR